MKSGIKSLLKFLFFIKARQQIKVLELNVINITPINKAIDSQTIKDFLLSHINSFNCNLIKVYLLLLLLLLITKILPNV